MQAKSLQYHFGFSVIGGNPLNAGTSSAARAPDFLLTFLGIRGTSPRTFRLPDSPSKNDDELQAIAPTKSSHRRGFRA